MAGTLDSILGVVIPIGAIIFFVAIMYKAMKEPIDLVLGGVKKVIVSIIDKTKGTGDRFSSAPSDVITYEPRY